MIATEIQRKEGITNGEPELSTYNGNLVIGPYGEPGVETLVLGNSSAALTEGVHTMQPDQYDAFDSSSQMLPWCPPGATLLVQMPREKMKPDNEAYARDMCEMTCESLLRAGVDVQPNLVFTENMHDYMRLLVDAAKRNPCARKVASIPLFPSQRLYGEMGSAQAAARINNKAEFIQIMKELEEQGVDLAIPVTYLDSYPSTKELMENAAALGTDKIFMKQNVSAGGFGVEMVDARDGRAVQDACQRWATRAAYSNEEGSDEWNYHIQLGVPNPRMYGDDIESPCIIGVIEPGQNGRYEPRILQVAQQRLVEGKTHIGNVIDPSYEARFLDQYGDQLYALADKLGQVGLRGHFGLDVIVGDRLSCIEVNPRLNGNSRASVYRPNLAETALVTTNNAIKVSEHADLDGLRSMFYDADRPQQSGLILTRFPRFAGDGIGLDFVNDYDGEVEDQAIAYLTR